MKIQRLALSHIAALLLGLLGGAGLLWSWSLRTEHRLVAQRDSLAARVVILDSTVAQARRDTTVIANQRVSVRWHAGRTDSLLDSVFVQAPDSLKPMVEALAGQLERERAARDSLVALLQTQIVTWRDSIVPSLQHQRDRAMSLLDASLRHKARRCGMGASAPFAVNTHGAGWGLAAGVSCRL